VVKTVENWAQSGNSVSEILIKDAASAPPKPTLISPVWGEQNGSSSMKSGDTLQAGRG
jgi:hypothetical protein